ncbi:MAG: M23 family metallopeptidase [Defluviitaleaceae bacterium]|nr:M23 family metallopeptidase [Defluviitaleaceae bacterium]
MSALNRPEWINPVEGPVTSLFGMRTNPVTHLPDFHNGLDIAVAVDTPVLAVRCAIVDHVGYTRLNGFYMRLICDEGYHIIYAHLNEILVDVDDIVSQGQKVARSGNTGQSTGPHLHYGLSRDGQWIDPLYRVDLQLSSAAALAYAQR